MTVRRAGALVVAGTAACTPIAGGDPSLALACQLESCQCVPASGTVFTGAEDRAVLWTRDGAAYCPEGQVLTRGGRRSDFVKRHGG